MEPDLFTFPFHAELDEKSGKWKVKDAKGTTVACVDHSEQAAREVAEALNLRDDWMNSSDTDAFVRGDY